jgi:type IX secretion system PorP/SprF family membrane protein
MKKVIKYIVLVLVQVAFVAVSQAQNLNFSQYQYTPFLTNPAMVAKDNALQLSLGYRQQRSFSGQKYATPMVSAILPFLQSSTSARRAGVGLSVISDREGDFMTNQGAMLALAYNIQIGKFKGYPMQLSFGAQGGFFSRRIDLNGLVTNSQINAGVIDNTAGSGESFQGNTTNILSFASGIYWHVSDDAGLPLFFLGVGAHNINEPNSSFLNTAGNSTIQMSRKLNLTAGYRILRTNNFSITPTVQVENILETLVRGGAWFRYHLGNSQTNVGAGVWYNTNKAATASLEWNQSAFFAAFSYDLALADDAQSWQSGSPEIHIGIRKSFGSKKTKDRDGDGVNDDVDECPKQAGTAATNGCPDADGDGVADKDDKCPNVAGVAKFNGCPDTDGDGIQDKDDECPQVAGVAKFKGCPDTDGDGIKDSEDACPKVAGPAKTKGCPDSDGDGVLDKDDECPQLKGTAATKGCPDSDSDGVIDKDDLCPKIAGKKELSGCLPVPEDHKKKIENTVVEIKDKAFAYRSAEVNPAMIPKLNELVEELKEHPHVTVKITGHTDHLGEESQNMELSLARAKAVEKYLKDKGVTNKMIVKGEGEHKPIAPNSTEEGRRKNRRVDVEVLYNGEK